MGRFKDSGRDRGRGGDRFGSRDGGEKTMFKATCSNCGKACEVPFEPRGDRPVFCRDCFKKQDSRDFRGGGRDRGGDRGRSDFGEKRMFTATCANCGDTCEVPFRPTGEKPVYCSNCFGKMGGRTGSREQTQKPTAQVDVASQLKSLHLKVDAILKVLAPTPKTPIVKVPDIKKEVAKPEIKKVLKKAKPKKVAKKVR